MSINHAKHHSVHLFVWAEAFTFQSTMFLSCRDVYLVDKELSNEDEVSCSRKKQRTPGEIRTCDLAIKSPALYQLS